VTGGREPAIAWNGKLVGPAPGAEARLGGVVAVSGGAWLALTAARGRPGGSDVALVFVTSDGAATRTVWLTETPEAEESPQLARAGDRIVVGWGLRGAADARLATVSDAGELLEGPVRVPARFAGTEGLAAFPDGDVGWGAAGDRPHQVEIARVAACR
jgi:hypothetical protein